MTFQTVFKSNQLQSLAEWLWTPKGVTPLGMRPSLLTRCLCHQQWTIRAAQNRPYWPKSWTEQLKISLYTIARNWTEFIADLLQITRNCTGFIIQNCSESLWIAQNLPHRIAQNCLQSPRIAQTFTVLVHLSRAELLRITQNFTSLVHFSGAELLRINCLESPRISLIVLVMYIIQFRVAQNFTALVHAFFGSRIARNCPEFIVYCLLVLFIEVLPSLVIWLTIEYQNCTELHRIARNCSESLGIPIPDIILCYLYIRSLSLLHVL